MGEFFYLEEIGKNSKILVVDDELLTLGLMKAILKKYFKEVVTFNDPRAALEAYKTAHFDIILSDFYMPQIDGLKFLEVVKNKNPFQIFIMMSSIEDLSLVINMVNKGVDGFIRKPLTTIEIKRTMDHLLQRIKERNCLIKYYQAVEEDYKQLMNKLNTITDTAKQLQSFQTSQEPASKSSSSDDFEVIMPDAMYAKHVSFDVDYKGYYKTLINEDKEELNDILSAMDSSLLLAFQAGTVNESYLSMFAEQLSRFGNVIFHYWLFSDIASSTLELSNAIKKNIQEIINNKDEVSKLLNAYSSVLHQYVDLVWKKEAENPLIFSESIQNDTGMILALINKKQDEREDEIIFFE